MRSTNAWFRMIPVLFLAVLAIPVRADEPKKSPEKAATESEADQIKRIGSRLDRFAPEMINSISFTMLHCAGNEAIDTFMKAIGSPDEHGKGFKFAVAVRDAGGLAKYRSRVIGLLSSKDVTVRGYGAQWLGLVGDDSCKEELMKLLKAKPAAPKKRKSGTELDESALVSDALAGFDRQMAATALGMLQAKECVDDLVTLLQEPNARVRAGGAMALAMLKAKEHSAAIAKMLDYEGGFDPRADEAKTAAILALVDFEAKQHAPAIAKMMSKGVGPFDDAEEMALFALVALEAKEQTKDIAALLKDDFKCGEAAVALALMGETDYAASISELLKKKDDTRYVRGKAAMALGILRAEKYAADIADVLKDSTDSERTTVAWALVLLENKEHAAKAVDAIGPEGMATFFSDWVPQRGSMIVAGQLNKVGKRAEKAFRTLQEEVKKSKAKATR
jgi:HEAT repeat protein